MHEIFSENLRNPARSHFAGLMRQFRSGQLDSTILVRIHLVYRYWDGHPFLHTPCKGHSQPLKLRMYDIELFLPTRHRGVRPESIEVRKSSIRPILVIQQASPTRMPETETTEF